MCKQSHTLNQTKPKKEVDLSLTRKQHQNAPSTITKATPKRALNYYQGITLFQ